MKLIKKINYALLLSALIIIFIELFVNYISVKVFLHCLLLLAILFGFNIVIKLVKAINKFSVRIAICLFMLFINYEYAQFFYEVDVTLLIVPENYKGNVSVLLGPLNIDNSIRPFNKTLTIRINKNGTFQTSSKYKIALNTIVVAEEKNKEIDFSKKLLLNNSKFKNLDSLSTNIYKLTGEINQ